VRIAARIVAGKGDTGTIKVKSGAV
jgi:hypothetical protein